MQAKRTILTISIVFMLLLGTAACDRNQFPDTVVLTSDMPGYLAMQHIVFLNDYLYGRTPFTYREKESAEWLVDTLLDMGYTEADIYVQEFHRDDVGIWMGIPAWEMRDIIDALSGDFQTRDYSQNIILTIPGQSEQIIVVGAHYDTLPYPGASDNASGTALLLESAYRMRYVEHYYTFVYIFFGAEEMGLLGARYYMDTRKDVEVDNILFMVNVDVLFEGPHLLYVVGSGADAAWITDAWDRIACDLDAQHDELEFTSFPGGLHMGSDHIIFYREGIPVIWFMGLARRMTGNFYARVLHSTRDCVHYIGARWPGKMERALWGYSLFLEAVLLYDYHDET